MLRVPHRQQFRWIAFMGSSCRGGLLACSCSDRSSGKGGQGSEWLPEHPDAASLHKQQQLTPLLAASGLPASGEELLTRMLRNGIARSTAPSRLCSATCCKACLVACARAASCSVAALPSGALNNGGGAPAGS